MFDTLFETRALAARRRTSVAASLFAHAAVIIAGIAASRDHELSGDDDADRPPREIIWRHPTPPAAPAGPVAPASPPRAPIVRPILIPPVETPPALPAIDFAAPPLRDDRYTITVVHPDAPLRGGPGALGFAARDTVYTERAVDKPALQISGVGVPEYPDLLRAAGVDGTVLASFVVDTIGRAEVGTLRIRSASRPEFAESVRRALPHMRFLAAEAEGRRVRQLVELPFVFAIRKPPGR